MTRVYGVSWEERRIVFSEVVDPTPYPSHAVSCEGFLRTLLRRPVPTSSSFGTFRYVEVCVLRSDEGVVETNKM